MGVDVDASADHHELGLLSFAFEIGDTGLRLQGSLMIQLRGELRLHHGGGFRQGLFGVSLDLRLAEAEVGPLGVDLVRHRRPGPPPGSS